jgi:hypothetical protein
MNASNNRAGIGMLAAAILILLAYHIPWIINPGAGLTLNAPDLAEWTTLHPAEAPGIITLFTSLLLRLPLVALAALLGVNSGRMWSSAWWIVAGLIVLLAALAAPPLEFVTDARDNTNYQQEFIVALAVIITGGFGLSGLMHRWRLPILVAVATTTIPAALIGLSRAYSRMSNFYLPAQIGLGGIMTAGAFAVVAMLAAGVMYKNRAAH